MEIVKASIEHLQDLIPLFDGYRKFYLQESDLRRSERFLSERIDNDESIIFMAYIDNKAVGFTQLYPIFSSVSMQRMLLLNDLYVDSQYRGKGIGEALITTAKKLCINKKYKGLTLETASNNPAQHLYERLEFKKDNFLHYFWATPNK